MKERDKLSTERKCIIELPTDWSVSQETRDATVAEIRDSYAAGGCDTEVRVVERQPGEYGAAFRLIGRVKLEGEWLDIEARVCLALFEMPRGTEQFDGQGLDDGYVMAPPFEHWRLLDDDYRLCWIDRESHTALLHRWEGDLAVDTETYWHDEVRLYVTTGECHVWLTRHGQRRRSTDSSGRADMVEAGWQVAGLACPRCSDGTLEDEQAVGINCGTLTCGQCSLVVLWSGD